MGRAILRPVLTVESCFSRKSNGWLRSLATKTLLVALAILIPFIGDLDAAANAPRLPPAQYQVLPLTRSSQNHLLVRGAINGKPAVLLVDTGAPLSAVAIDRREYFGMTPVGAKSRVPARLNINGAFNSMSIAHGVQLGALNLVDEAMVLIDFAYLHPSTKKGEKRHRESDGILGTDILSPLKAVLDYERMLLVLSLDPRKPGPASGFDFRGYRQIRMRESEGFNLYVDGSVNGRRARLMVDTGAFATLLHSPFVQKMNIPLRPTSYRSIGVNLAQNRLRIATIPRFSIGSMDMQTPSVGVVNLQGLIQDGLLEGSPPVAGLLGSETLHQYHAIIDFGSNSLYLKR